MLLRGGNRGNVEGLRKGSQHRDGFYEAEKKIVKEDNPLYESLLGKLRSYPELKSVLYELLFNGRAIPYTATSDYIKDAAMFGFIKNERKTFVAVFYYIVKKLI